jgi:cytoplasmic iron level regulating protein YaaA (DUF328/UPF0246 family)
MPRTIALVACVAVKAKTPCQAKDLYISPWFVKASAYAEKVADAWFILSAKYGLLGPHEIIAPYNETLNRMPATARRAWAAQVFEDLKAVIAKPGDRIVMLAGKRYREHLVDPLQAYGCLVEIPMEGLGIGKQLQWLNQHL